MKYSVVQSVSEGSTLAGRFWWKKMGEFDDYQSAREFKINIRNPMTDTKVIEND